MPNTLAVRIEAKAGRDLAGFFDLIEAADMEATSSSASEIVYAFDGLFTDLRLDLQPTAIGLPKVLGFNHLNFGNPVATFVFADPVDDAPLTPDGGGLFGALLGFEIAFDVHGSRFADRALGYLENDTFDMAGGNDKVFAGGGDDTAHGGAGRDVLKGEAGDDTLSGGDGNDTLRGGAGRDALLGEAGNDNLDGGTGGDIVSGGDGDDVVKGGGGNDVLAGNAGDDTLNGGKGADVLTLGEGSDTALGGGGNDVFLWADPALEGGARGTTQITGGTGRDSLVIYTDESNWAGIEAEIAARTAADAAAGHWDLVTMGLTLDEVERVFLRAPGMPVDVPFPDPELFARAVDLGAL